MSKEIRMYDTEEIQQHEEKRHFGNGNFDLPPVRLKKPNFSFLGCLVFLLSGLFLSFVLFSVFSRTEGEHQPRYARYGTIIIKAYKQGINVSANHVFEGDGKFHAQDCPCHFSEADSVRNPHIYDSLLEAVEFYDAHPDLQWYVRDAIGAYHYIHKRK